MTSANVTQLDFNRQAAARHPDGKRLNALRTRFKDLLPPLMDGFFSASDDFLFKLAEKGDVNSSEYFDQLRVLRRRKGDIKHHVLNTIDAWLAGGAQEIADELDAIASANTDPEEPKFSLMDDASLERTLAIDSFATRTIEKAGDHWLAFHERMMALTCQKSLSDKNTPFNPAALGKIVLQEIETIDAPFKTSLMLFRLFDEMTIPKLLAFYKNSNTWLAEEGVLPNLKLIQSRAANSAPVKAETIAQISANLAGIDTSNIPTQGAAYPLSGNGGMAAAGNGVMIDPGLFQQMMTAMAHIQTQPAPPAHSLDELKTWTANQANAVTQQAEGTLEAGTVSLVAMLFEYILNDEQLSAHMKQLLARMQIPIIKVAILDKDFFTNTDHSARLLLNRMARSATGWHADANIENDVLLDGMEKIVTQLNHEFDHDLSIFDQLLDEFSALLEQYEQQKSTKIETVKEAEEAAFEEHQQQDRARLFIDTLLENETLPESLDGLITDYWYRLMKGIMDKQGDGKAWQTSGRIARELVWSLQPSVQATQAARFAQVTPKLLDGLAGGLKAVGMQSEQIKQAIANIKNHYQLYAQPINEDIWEAQEKLESFEVQSEKAESLIEQPAPLPVDEPIVPIKNADLSYYLDQVESLTTDQWFDIEQSDGRFVRGCLSLIIGGGSKYVFTDHQGEKLAERSAIGLAMAMRNEQFNLINEDPLFDRMIDTLVDELGNTRASGPSAK